MNQLQSELRLARSLIAERDSEIQRVRITNNQVCVGGTGVSNYILCRWQWGAYCKIFYYYTTVRGGEWKTQSNFRWMEHPGGQGIMLVNDYE